MPEDFLSVLCPRRSGHRVHRSAFKLVSAPTDQVLFFYFTDVSLVRPCQTSIVSEQAPVGWFLFCFGVYWEDIFLVA